MKFQIQEKLEKTHLAGFKRLSPLQNSKLFLKKHIYQFKLYLSTWVELIRATIIFSPDKYAAIFYNNPTIGIIRKTISLIMIRIYIYNKKKKYNTTKAIIIDFNIPEQHNKIMVKNIAQ